MKPISKRAGSSIAWRGGRLQYNGEVSIYDNLIIDSHGDDDDTTMWFLEERHNDDAGHRVEGRFGGWPSTRRRSAEPPSASGGSN
jgi:hypothetical protein